MTERENMLRTIRFERPDHIPMIFAVNPACYEHYKPSYQRMMKLARDKGKIVHMHSDGDIKLLAEDLLDTGVDILNLQDLANGVEWIEKNLKGKVCIDLDIDRQKITRFGTPDEVEKLVRDEVETLGSPDGGLMFTYGLYPGIPEKNVSRLMDALEKYMIL